MSECCFWISRSLLLGLGLLACCACARKPLIIAIPDANASEGQQNAQAINSAISILRQLEGNPRGIEIEMRQPDQAHSSGQRGF